MICVALSALCREEGLWFHVDGAYGALGVLSPVLAPRLAGMEQRGLGRASISTNGGRCLMTPASCWSARASRHRDTFSSPAAYLRRETRGLAAGSQWPCDLGPDLSRGFRALKTWFTLKAYGAEKLGAMIARTCALAGYLEAASWLSRGWSCLRRCSSTSFASVTAPLTPTQSMPTSSSTSRNPASPRHRQRLDGQLAIRAAIVNHRTDTCDIDALVSAVLEFGARRSSSEDGPVPELERSPPLAM